MCKHGTDKQITIRQTITVDACLADLVVALNDVGVQTVNCCCGHGDGSGSVIIRPSSIQRALSIGYEVIMGAGDQYPWIKLPAPMPHELLRARRKAAGIGLNEMARARGMSAAYLSDIERGRRRIPDDLVSAPQPIPLSSPDTRIGT
jgi:hypothetical protein